MLRYLEIFEVAYDTMGVQGFTDAAERGHLVGDVPALILVAIVLAVLMPRTATVAVQTPRTAQA